MNKMTHLKFNLNNFLFSLSDATDYIHMNNLHGVAFNSKRVAYIALKIATLNEMPKDFISDLLSYALIAHNQHLKTNIDLIPFNDSNNLHNEDCTKLIAIASFFELQIKIENNLIVNRDELIDLFECKDCFDEIFTENLLYLMEYDSFWFDLTNTKSLSFKILDMIDDFTIEYEYSKLIKLSKLYNDIYYDHTNRTQSNDIQDSLSKVANHYNFDEKDTSRFIISGYLSYIGFLYIPSESYSSDGVFNKIEFNQIPYNTYETLSRVFGFDDIAVLASCVNENIDGSGYPYKKQGNELSLKFRALSIVYRLQALSESRVYRKDYTESEIVETIKKEAQNGLLDNSVLSDVLKLTHN